MAQSQATIIARFMQFHTRIISAIFHCMLSFTCLDFDSTFNFSYFAIVSSIRISCLLEKQTLCIIDIYVCLCQYERITLLCFKKSNCQYRGIFPMYSSILLQPSITDYAGNFLCNHC